MAYNRIVIITEEKNKVKYCVFFIFQKLKIRKMFKDHYFLT